MKSFNTDNTPVPVVDNPAQPTQPKKRLEFIDLAKGICIILVVATHCSVGFSDKYLLLLHLRMPLYFFLSGYFFKNYGTLGNTARKKADSLLIPLLFFAAIYILIITAFRIVSHESVSISDYFSDGRIKIIALWFLPCLFWQAMICYFISKINNFNYQLIIATVVTGIGIIFANQNVGLPLHLDSALTCFPFFFLGYVIKRTSNLLVANYPKRYTFPVIAVLIATACVIAVFNNFNGIEFYINTYTGSILLHYLQAFAMIIAIILLAKEVKHLPIISFAGRYSIIIMGIHGIIMIIAVKAASMAGISLPAEILFLIVAMISILSIYPIKKWFPKLTAQKPFLARKNKK